MSSKSLWAWTKTPRARTLFRACRWVHVYLSTLFFGLLIYFCVTGIMLNHTDWYTANGDRDLVSGQLPTDLAARLRDGQRTDLTELEAYIAEQWRLTDPRKVQHDRDVNEITLDYPLPAGYAFVTVFAEEGTLEMERQKGTLLGVLADLHKGRHSGIAWSWVIDLSAIGMILLALSGFAILFQQAKWRTTGLIAMVAGCVTPWLIYLAWVPRLIH